MKLLLCYTKDEIQKLLYRDSIFKEICWAESEILPDTWDSDFDNYAYFKILNENEAVLGLWILRSLGNDQFNVHMGLFKEFRGIATPQLVQNCLALSKEHQPGCYWTLVSEENLACQKMLLKAGFKELGCIPNAIRGIINAKIYG